MDAVIVVEKFSKSFGSKQVHRDLDFHLNEGEVCALIGGSGSGKSVLCRALIGLEKPDSGRIFFRGQDVTDYDENEWRHVRKKIAYVFQSGALFDSLSVEENLLYPLDAHRRDLSRKEKQAKIDEVLEMLGLKGANQLLPSSLSGGMQKRAGLARALMLDPEIILYDEPTAGLDPFNTKNIQDMINDMKATGRAGVLVTHDMPSAFATCDRMSLLMEGRIAIEGPTAELRENSFVQSFVTGEIAYGKAQQ